MKPDPAVLISHPILELDLASQLGIKRTIVAKARKEKFIHGTDWLGGNRVTIRYTRAAADRMLALFVTPQVMNGKLDIPVPIPVAKDPEIVNVEVIRANFNNTHIITARPIELANGGPGEELRIRVKDASKFIPKMRFRAKRPPGSDVWFVAGREPRYRGRW